MKRLLQEVARTMRMPEEMAKRIYQAIKNDQMRRNNG